jgi:hypothetical protein
MMNCNHGGTGWCLECVVKMGNEWSEMRGLLRTMLDSECGALWMWPETARDTWVEQVRLVLGEPGAAKEPK